MESYFITNTVSGQCLGIYEGTDEDSAAQIMRRDAGYATDESAAKVLGVGVDELNDDLVIQHIDSAYQWSRRSVHLPDGWDLYVWPNGRAMVCSPSTSPRELGGYDATVEDEATALDNVAELIESL